MFRIEGPKSRLVSSDIYRALIALSWPAFFTVLSGAFLLVNLLFRLAYWLLPASQLDGIAATGGERYLEARHEGKPCLMFRIASERLNEVVDAKVNVSLLRSVREPGGGEFRRIDDLTLRRNRSPVFALTWSVIHFIDESSPFHNETAESILSRDPSLMISFTGIDETLSQTVHSRHSYGKDDFRWNQRFVDILGRLPGGVTRINIERFHDIEPLPHS